MKKKLLLSFAVFATALSVNAQKQNLKQYSKIVSKEATNIYANQANYFGSSNYVKRTETIIDTASITMAKWSLAKGKAQMYDIIPEYKSDGTANILFATQKFPMVGEMTLKGLGVFLHAKNPSGKTSVDVQVIANDSVVVNETLEFNSTSNFSQQFVPFSKSYNLVDTFKVILSGKSDADSISILTSGDVSSLGMNSFNGALQVLSLDKTGKVTGLDNYGIASAGGKVVDADFQIYPIVEYSFSGKAKADKTCLPKADMTVNFDFSQNMNLLSNPYFNVNAFFIKFAGQGKKEKKYFAIANYDDKGVIDTIDTGGMKFAHLFSGNNTHNVSVTESFKIWGSKKTSVVYNQTTSFSLGVCASLDESALKGLNIYPNPVANELNVSFNASSAATIELVNVAGQVIETKNTSEFANVTFNTAELNAGVYFVNIKVAEGTFTQKIIKE